MLKERIVELYNSGVKLNDIAKILNINRPCINENILKVFPDRFPKCKICNKSIMSVNQSHLKVHNIKIEDYFVMFPEEKKNQGDPAWNRGLNKENSEFVKKNANALSEFLNKPEQVKKRSEQNKKMWQDGVFKTDVELCLENNKKWVKKVKEASVDERRILLANFVKSGNNKQKEIRNENKLNLDFHKKKYTWSKNVCKKNCIQCGLEYISTLNKAKHFCSNMCYLNYIETHEYDEFIKHWINKHPNWTRKKKYFSEKYNTEYTIDSSYELDFIKWCEINGIKSLVKYRPIIKYVFNNKIKKYYPDFLINDDFIVEIKANSIRPYHLESEKRRLHAGLNQSYKFKLISDKELYVNVRKNRNINEILKSIVFSDKDFIGGIWEKEIGFDNDY